MNKIGLILFILFLVAFAGSIYFFIYNVPQSGTSLALSFYFSALILFIIALVYGRKNIKNQLSSGFSSESKKKTFPALIILIVGGVIINFISKYIGGQNGFTVGLILALILLGIIFYIFKNKK